jgi:solute carrier family 12 sodium/potassium/chloride transporter 2
LTILEFKKGQCLIIIAISTFITLVTAMSMSAIATNGEIGGGTNQRDT